jgi:hypothetical protein
MCPKGNIKRRIRNQGFFEKRTFRTWIREMRRREGK